MNETLKLLRYNTGTDKKVFVKFKDDVSAVIFNATIVAFSRSAVADLVSVHKNQYIIDPQTHIFQHKIDAIQTKDKNGERVNKKSVLQYFAELPEELTKEFLSCKGELSTNAISNYLEQLVDSVYVFETKYVDKYIKKKEYDKYLEYVKLGPEPRIVIAPYFMLKSSYSDKTISSWMELNRNAAVKFISKNMGIYPVGLQLVLDSDILERDTFISEVEKNYKALDAEYIFIWIDEYNGFDATYLQQKRFKELLQTLNRIGLKPVMAYGGFDSVLLCSSSLSNRLYGVAHSVGYGESRPITPVGGGIPVNKYYFPPLHSRMNIPEVLAILRKEGFFSTDENEHEAIKFYKTICDCKQCKTVIKHDIDNFIAYNASSSFTIKGKNGITTRNIPTTEANYIAAMHFMYSKCKEWELIDNFSYEQLTKMLMQAYNRYDPKNYLKISRWCKLYGE